MFAFELPREAQEMLQNLPTLSENCKTVLEKRYLDKTDDKEFKEDPDGLFWRVSEFIARAESASQKNQKTLDFFQLMRGGFFLPNSPTLANAGTRTGQLSACFVLPVEDALANGKHGIFDTLTKAQLIFQTGGGVGYAFTRLREKGALVSSTKGVSTGPVGYMDVYDEACANIAQGGMRRGAQMGILRVDHPDIMEFIDRKSDLSKLTNFNVSVGITDAFLEALARGKRGESDAFDLVSPGLGTVKETVPASKIWTRIIERAHATGEPGIVFLDRMNDENPVPRIGAYEATNPCGEQPLAPYESCNLGSMVQDRYVENGAFMKEKYEADIRLATAFMDNVVDMNEYVPARGHNPGVPEIKETTLKTRKLGLGIMGMARALFKMGLSYDSPQGREFAEYLYALLDVTSKEASVELAKERGAYPYMQENWDECVAFYTRIWEKRIKQAESASFWDIADRYRALIPEMAKHGMRNSTTTTIAPTGTISIIADTCGGCEPEFSLYTSRWQAGVEMVELNPVFVEALTAHHFTSEEIDLIMASIRDRKVGKGSLNLALQNSESLKTLPEQKQELLAVMARYFKVAGDIAPSDHVLMQASLQKYNDSACSKTINFPEEATLEEVAEAYDLAISTGCKGITIYRDNCRQFQPLTAGAKEETKVEAAKPAAEVLATAGLARERAGRLFGFNDRIETGDGRLHLQVGYDEMGIREVIATVGKAGGVLNGLVEAIGRLISLALKYRVPVPEIAGQLCGIRSANARGIGWRQILSIPDAIGKALLEAPTDLIATTAGSTEESVVAAEAPMPELKEVVFAVANGEHGLHSVHDWGESPECPNCGAPMKFGEGCRGGSCTDPSCGFAKC